RGMEVEIGEYGSKADKKQAPSKMLSETRTRKKYKKAEAFDAMLDDLPASRAVAASKGGAGPAQSAGGVLQKDQPRAAPAAQAAPPREPAAPEPVANAGRLSDPVALNAGAGAGESRGVA